MVAPGNVTQGRKRLAFTIKQKMKIIQEIERGKSKSDVARELGLASSTVATIWKNRESIAESWRNRDMMHSELDVETAKKIISQAPVANATAHHQQQQHEQQQQEQQQQSVVQPLPLVSSQQQQSPASLTTPMTLTTTKLSTTSASEPSVVPSAHQPDHLQQAQSQTQSQELLEVRSTLTTRANKQTPSLSLSLSLLIPSRCLSDAASKLASSDCCQIIHAPTVDLYASRLY